MLYVIVFLYSNDSQILLKNGSNGYLVGESLTFADLGLLEVLLYVKDYYESAVFEAFPNVLVILQ